MLSKELEFSLNRAFKEARTKHHEYMTVEHLLLSLLDNPTAARVLRACGAGLGSVCAGRSAPSSTRPRPSCPVCDLSMRGKTRNP